MPTITVAAVVISDSQGRVLTVRKRGTRYFMFPGGKPEPGEEPVRTAVREVREELGLEVGVEELDHLGRWETTAANEADHALIGEVFFWNTPDRVGIADRVRARAEIDELLWLDPAVGMERDDVAPLTRDCVFPEIVAHP